MGLTRHRDAASHDDGPPAAAGAPFTQEALGHADAAVRRGAATRLGADADAAEALCARLHGETDAGVRSALFTSLARIGSADAVRGLLPLLRSDDAALRTGAIEALAGMPQQVAPSIDALLADADGDVRIFAVNLLGDLPHPRVPAWLRQVLEHETAVNVIGAAIEAAAEAGDRALLPALAALRARFADEPYIGFAVDVAVERIEGH